MQRRLYSFLSLDLSVAAITTGYIFGLFIPILFRDVWLISDIPTISSAFISGGGAAEFFYTSCAQAVYPVLIFLLGFIPCTSVLCAGILFTRAALASYSSLAISFSGASNYMYLLHALCGISMIAVCWAVSKCARSFANDASRKSALLYSLEFLFFVGILLIILFCRHIALAFI